MKRMIIAASTVLALAAPVCAAEIGGVYDIKGTNLDGSAYGGTAEIKVTSDSTCEIYWTTGGSTSQGICMLDGNALAAAYVMGKAIGLVVYLVQDDGVLDGTWTIAGQNGRGTEVLTPQ